MKKLLLLLLVFSLCLGGCGLNEGTVTYTYEDLTIRIPEGYLELSGEDYAEDLTFLFGRDPVAVNGLREEKATFEAHGLKLDLKSYGALLLQSNNVLGTLQKKNGIYTFSYEAGDLTYVATLYETDTAFWTVQAYCPTAKYNKLKNALWDILSSVTV